MEIKELAFDNDFRKKFTEFKSLYASLDSLGGKNCKSCNVRKQRLVLKELERRIYSNDTLKSRFKKEYGQPDTLGFLNFDVFKKAVLLEEIRILFSEYYPEITEEIKLKISKEGYFADSLEANFRKMYREYQVNTEFFNSFSRVLGSNSRNKLLQASTKCKIIKASGCIDLENQINEFILDNQVDSLSFNDLTAVILYRKVG